MILRSSHMGGFTLPLVAKCRAWHNAKGWQMTMACVRPRFAWFALSHLPHHPRAHPADPKQKVSAKQDFGDLLKNGPWIAMFTLTVCHFLVLAMEGRHHVYYFRYYVNQDRLYGLLQSLGLSSASGDLRHGTWHYLLSAFGLIVDGARTNVSSVGFSLFNMSSLFVTLLGGLCSTFFCPIRYCKRAVLLRVSP